MGLLYIKHSSLTLDLKLIGLTALTLVNREKALELVEKLLHDLHADRKLAKVARRRDPLLAAPPPGATDIVTSRA